ncbi:rod shape-determining protein [Natroniella sulfidigena]|uniref:rod shape-determining protein n=1 Tax=Natroniella sulfidigena TaxID=723921 RepID=UPI00200B7690|nr:rod shape-determining protein [Natroniella sulfidigena]MCK8817439.1 rod shape-determining protein [Natroniella sulfidigena]
MIKFLTSLFSKDLAIDLGTSNTLVYIEGEEIVIRESSVVAIKNKVDAEEEVVAVGNEAKRMTGKAPWELVIVRPLKDGVIADFEVTEKMLNYFITKVHNRKNLVNPKIVVCIPSGVTEIEKKTVVDTSLKAGAKEAYLIEEPMAAAIGAGLPINKPIGNMIVDIGGGTTEIAVISLGGIVTKKSIKIAGDEMDQAIVDYLRDDYNLMIGNKTAERIKIEIGSAYFGSGSAVTRDNKIEVRGRNLLDGLPKRIEVSALEIQLALENSVNSIIRAIKETLEETPAELSTDIIDRGITMAGGGSLLSGLDQLIANKTGVSVYLADNPLDCIVLGTGKVLQELKKLRKILV